MNRVLEYFTGFTSKFYLGVIAALILSLPAAYCKGRSDGRELERAKRAEIVAQALAQARKADSVARDTVDSDKALSGAEIERGRDAADGSDDPWGAAVEAMR